MEKEQAGRDAPAFASQCMQAIDYDQLFSVPFMGACSGRAGVPGTLCTGRAAVTELAFFPLFAALLRAPSARARCRPEGQRQRQPRLCAGGEHSLGYLPPSTQGLTGH